jgi:hypothetical protein
MSMPQQTCTQDEYDQTPGELVCSAYQLMPGDPCSAYANSYRFLGSLDPMDPENARKNGYTWTDELLEYCKIHRREKTNRHIAREIETWVRATADKLHWTHSTG